MVLQGHRRPGSADRQAGPDHPAGLRHHGRGGRDRREVLAKVDRGQLRPSAGGLKVDELLDLYLDGIDADERLSAKTRFDYRHYADDYIRPYIGDAGSGTSHPEVILAWQRKLAKEGGTKRKGQGRQAANPGRACRPTPCGWPGRRSRAPSSWRWASGMIPTNPLVQAPRPKPQAHDPEVLVTRGGPQVPRR